MLKHATCAQSETFESLKVVFTPEEIKFTLVGAAACREHGLPRPTDDLDIVVCPYPTAMDILSRSGEFRLEPKSVGRVTCTRQHLKTGVAIDFFTGGSRIFEQVHANGGIVHDPLPIPHPSGFGNVATLPSLIAMKLSAVISGTAMVKFGVTSDAAKIQQHVEDVGALISICKLGRDLPLGDDSVQQRYREIYDSRNL